MSSDCESSGASRRALGSGFPTRRSLRSAIQSRRASTRRSVSEPRINKRPVALLIRRTAGSFDSANGSVSWSGSARTTTATLAMLLFSSQASSWVGVPHQDHSRPRCQSPRASRLRRASWCCQDRSSGSGRAKRDPRRLPLSTLSSHDSAAENASERCPYRTRPAAGSSLPV